MYLGCEPKAANISGLARSNVHHCERFLGVLLAWRAGLICRNANSKGASKRDASASLIVPKLIIQSPEGRLAKSAPLIDGRTTSEFGRPCGVGAASSATAVSYGMSNGPDFVTPINETPRVSSKRFALVRSSTSPVFAAPDKSALILLTGSPLSNAICSLLAARCSLLAARCSL